MLNWKYKIQNLLALSWLEETDKVIIFWHVDGVCGIKAIDVLQTKAIAVRHGRTGRIVGTITCPCCHAVVSSVIDSLAPRRVTSNNKAIVAFAMICRTLYSNARVYCLGATARMGIIWGTGSGGHSRR
jgi:hypothetical protein